MNKIIVLLYVFSLTIILGQSQVRSQKSRIFDKKNGVDYFILTDESKNFKRNEIEKISNYLIQFADSCLCKTGETTGVVIGKGLSFGNTRKKYGLYKIENTSCKESIESLYFFLFQNELVFFDPKMDWTDYLKYKGFQKEKYYSDLGNPIKILKALIKKDPFIEEIFIWRYQFESGHRE